MIPVFGDSGRYNAGQAWWGGCVDRRWNVALVHMYFSSILHVCALARMAHNENININLREIAGPRSGRGGRAGGAASELATGYWSGRTSTVQQRRRPCTSRSTQSWADVFRATKLATHGGCVSADGDMEASGRFVIRRAA